MKKNIYTIFLLFLLVEVSYSQGIVPTYSFAHVTKDFDYYINTLKTKHPNLYAFVSEDYFNNEVEQARSMENNVKTSALFGWAFRYGLY